MNFVKKLSLLLVFLSGFHTLHAQEGKLKIFTDDSVKFIDNLETYMETGIATHKDVKEFLQKFTATWKSPSFGHYYKEATYSISNEMLTRKIPVYPSFQTFLSAMMNFVNSGLSQTQFDQWKTALEKLLKQRPYNNLNNFLSMSESLFGDNTLYKSPTISWKSNSNKFNFKSDSVPEVIFTNLNLKCTNERNDTLVIYSTQGIFYPNNGLWIGNGGKVDWVRTGLDANNVYAELSNYSIICRQGGFASDSVIFWDKSYFDKPILGKIIERDVSEAAGKETYPRFVSYGKRFAIPNLTPDVTYNGGFSMRGRRFVGSGTTAEPAQLIFKRNNKPFFIASSVEYGITKDQIIADDASIVIHLNDTDSIYHPDIQMVYNIPKKHLSLIRTEQGLSQTPYFDTYHKVNMFFEELSWNTDEPKMEFRMLEGAAQSVADFESADFFRPELFDKFNDPTGSNVILTIAQYSKSVGGNDFLVSDIASYMHTTSDDMRPTIMKLATIGLLMYDIPNDKIHVEDRLKRFISNKMRKTDYDVLDYHSENPGRGVDNGIMDLLTNDITINGVKVIIVSDSENVYIYPKDQQVVLHKNRNSSFGGNVHAGRFDFYGKHFDFNYDDFKIKLNMTDSIRIQAESYETNSKGEHFLVPVKSVIEHVSGEIKLDYPTNKSGFKPYHQYPILTSDSNSFVFYNKKTVQNGVYNKDKFYFKLDPFVIDSLNRFSNAGLHFGGTFASADIVPEMRETLKLQPDYSLGFVHDAPEDGIALYGGKGRFFSKLKLSNRGLKGDGTINYVTSVSKSNDFTFYPDSMNAIANKFVVNEQKTPPEFPPVTGDTVREHWLPKQDHMAINDIKYTFLIYTGPSQSIFHGMLDLSPDLLAGNGEIDFLRANLVSKLIKFRQHKFTADTSDFSLEATDNSGIAFATNNMTADVDFETQMGEFKSNGGGSVVKFPENEYIAFMDEFKWYMNQDMLELSSSKKQSAQVQGKELQFSGAKFISVDSKQDSLQFIAPSARYSLKDFLITAQKVPFINVADAQIIPDSGKVLIHKKAIMEPLVRAEITANTVTRYHHIYNADLSITSRKNYSGSGYYDYVDEIKNKKAIYFNNIHVDTTHQTVANTTIPDTAHFNLSPNFGYQGSVTLKATNPFLYFNGEARIMHQCNEIKIAWVKFNSQIDPSNVQIPIESHPVNETNIPLAASPVLAVTDSMHMYGAFLSPVINGKKDIVTLVDSGYLDFDKPTQQYRIASKEKLIEQSLPGNYVSLDTRRCILSAEGKFNLGPDYGSVDMQTVGNMTDYLVPDSVVSKVMVLLNFFFDDGALDKMAADFTNMGSLKPIDVTKGDVQKNLHELIGKEQADKLISQLTLYGTTKKIPKELQSSLFFSQLTLKWNNQTRSYVSEGKIGVGSVGKTMVNKLCDGKIEFKKKRGADEINIYIELDPQHWYYFNYVNGFMQATSSNNDFNNAISALKPDKREQKTDKGKYTFNVSTSNKKTIFLRHFSDNGDNGGDNGGGN
ncbi:MAG: hypothetical protein ACLQQ4_17035 [Bacteroidia bacterium]